MTSTMHTEMRNADLGALVDLLQKQNDVKYDVVVTQDRLSFDRGALLIAGAGAIVTDDGVDECDLRFNPTAVFDDSLCAHLGIPRAYLRTLRESNLQVAIDGLPGLYDPDADVALPSAGTVSVLDANVNGWLQREPGKKMLVRAFHTGDPDDEGIARAFLSDRFAPIDNYDVLLAGLDAVRETGVNVVIDGADLTERSMRVRLYSPDVVAMAPVLLQSYRSPYATGTAGDGLPVVWGGFEIRNSETGGGSFQIVPRFVVEICKNGLTVPKEALRQVHLGGRLDEGIVRWSHETQQKAVELVKAKTADAVRSFLDPTWVATIIGGIEHTSSTPITDAPSTIERVGKAMGYSESEQTSILDCFIKSGDLTAGGVMQAVTAAAQRVESSDRAMALEDSALEVLALAAI